MGLIPNSSVIIERERQGVSVIDLLTDLRAKLGAELVAFSTISVIELEHGIWRAKDAVQAARRRKFFDDLFTAVPCYPLTVQVARRAAQVDGESRQRGVTIPFQDPVIGVTALEFNYVVATRNVRHFQLIPDLTVRQL